MRCDSGFLDGGLHLGVGARAIAWARDIFAGEHLAELQGTMEGAVISGEAAATAVLARASLVARLPGGAARPRRLTAAGVASRHSFALEKEETPVSTRTASRGLTEQS